MSARHPLPKNRREYAAALKRAEASIYRGVAKTLRENPFRYSLEEHAERYDVFAQDREDHARYAETAIGADVNRTIDLMIDEVLR